MIARPSVIRCALWITLVTSLQVSLPAQAQTEMQASANEACISRSRTSAGENREFRLRIQRSELPKFAQRGFRERDCAGVRNSLAKAVPHMCEIAALNDAGLEQEFEARHGVTPSEICEIGKR